MLFRSGLLDFLLVFLFFSSFVDLFDLTSDFGLTQFLIGYCYKEFVGNSYTGCYCYHWVTITNQVESIFGQAEIK